ncbi:hypothetical protein ABFP00_14310 [Acinetobacter baumannii]
MNNEEIDDMLLDECFKATFLASATQLNRDIQKLSLEHSNPIEAANIYAQELKDKLFVNTTQDEQHQLINKISMSYLIFARALETNAYDIERLIENAQYVKDFMKRFLINFSS